MNEIKLNKLSLRDFQGGTITLNAKGEDVFISGANATGKTRLVSAFAWLLFNKDALGRTDFEIKNLDFQGEATHGLEHMVEAELSINGEIEILKKVYKEKWTKKRGQAEREFSGHAVEYFVNGVPLQEKLYLQHIIDIAGDESRFRLLTSPTTFPALHWQKQRQLLLEVCGDLSDADVMASDEKLFPLRGILGKRTLDDHRKVVTARRTEINKEMEKIPIRIDEVRRGMPDITGLDRKASENKVQTLETALNDAKLRLQGVDTGGNIADLTKKLAGLNADARKMEEGHRSGALATLNRLNQQISEVGVKVEADRRKLQAIDRELKQKDINLKTIEKNLIQLREKWISIDAETAKRDDPTDEYCLACGQPLPLKQVEEAKTNYLRAFNQSKAERLGEIDRKGHDLKEQTDRLQDEIEILKKEFETLAIEVPSMEHKLKIFTDDRDALKESSEDFSGLPHWSETFGEIEAIEEEIKAEREGISQDVEKIKAERASIQGKLTVAKDTLDKFTRREHGERRIEELKAEEKKLSAEFEKLESELYLIELFIKTKVSLLTERINEKFESGLPGLTVRFKLFNQLINGGVEECCEIIGNGIPYNAGLNNSARIQAGCVIVKTLQQHFKMNAPIFIDNRESVSELPKLDCQLISLVVSPEDKTLRIERR